MPGIYVYERRDGDPTDFPNRYVAGDLPSVLKAFEFVHGLWLMNRQRNHWRLARLPDTGPGRVDITITFKADGPGEVA